MEEKVESSEDQFGTTADAQLIAAFELENEIDAMRKRAERAETDANNSRASYRALSRRVEQAEAEVERLREQLEEANEDLTYWQEASDWDDEAFDTLYESLEYWQERSAHHWELLKRSAREALQDRKVRADRDRHYRRELREAWQAAADLARKLEE